MRGVDQVRAARVLTAETAFSGAMLERSQYAPSSNSAGAVGWSAVGGVDVGLEDASLMLSMIVWTSASVGGAALSSCSAGVSGPCPLDRTCCSVAPSIANGGLPRGNTMAQAYTGRDAEELENSPARDATGWGDAGLGAEG